MIRFILITALMIMCNLASAATILLTCDIPTEREDGSAIQQLDGYKLYHSYNGAKPDQIIDLPPTPCGYTFENAQPGYYDFQISSVEFGQEGKKSPILRVDIPYAPSNAPLFIKATIEYCYNATDCFTKDFIPQ